MKAFITFSILLFTGLTLFSCNSNDNSSGKSTGTQDTLQVPSVEKKEESQNGITLSDSTVPDNSALPTTSKKEKQKSLIVIDAKILFDSDFKPSLSAKLMNEMDEGIVAFELFIKPSLYNNSNCKSVYKKIKVSISAGSTITLKKAITEEFESDCFKSESPNVIIGEIILSSGKKVKAPSFLDQFDNAN